MIIGGMPAPTGILSRRTLMLPTSFWHLVALNLWNPSGVGMGLAMILATALLLGFVHGITPDEHTWPITFSYAVGSYSWKGGMRAGFLFSLTFTLQRAIMCEIAYFAINSIKVVIENDLYNSLVYIIVGLIMAGSGVYIMQKGKIWHMFHSHKMLHSQGGANPQTAPWWMPMVHGFVAGWGTGAFAIMLYTTLAPNMGSPWLAFLPGIAFGIGTMVMQMLIGSIFGQWMARRKLSENARILLARLMSGRTLTWGGAGFMLVGGLEIIFPKLSGIQFNTGIKVHNLAHLGDGFFLAVILLFSVAAYSFFKSMRDIQHGAVLPEIDPKPDCGHQHHGHFHAPAAGENPPR